jgi:hypothetical protein
MHYRCLQELSDEKKEQYRKNLSDYSTEIKTACEKQREIRFKIKSLNILNSESKTQLLSYPKKYAQCIDYTVEAFNLLENALKRLGDYKEDYVSNAQKTTAGCPPFFSFFGKIIGSSGYHGSTGIKRANYHHDLFVEEMKKQIQTNLTTRINQLIKDNRVNVSLLQNILDDELQNLVKTLQCNSMEVVKEGGNLNTHSYAVYLMRFASELDALRYKNASNPTSIKSTLITLGSPLYNDNDFSNKADTKCYWNRIKEEVNECVTKHGVLMR